MTRHDTPVVNPVEALDRSPDQAALDMQQTIELQEIREQLARLERRVDRLEASR